MNGHFNEARAEWCGAYWLNRIKECLEGTASPAFKSRRVKLLADRAYLCFNAKLEELDRHVQTLDPDF